MFWLKSCFIRYSQIYPTSCFTSYIMPWQHYTIIILVHTPVPYIHRVLSHTCTCTCTYIHNVPHIHRLQSATCTYTLYHTYTRCSQLHVHTLYTIHTHAAVSYMYIHFIPYIHRVQSDACIYMYLRHLPYIDRVQ